MSMLSPRLQLKVSQKQILTPGLVQMVTVLQLNRLELKDMITQEIAENPVLEETADGVEELTPEPSARLSILRPCPRTSRTAPPRPRLNLSQRQPSPKLRIRSRKPRKIR